MEGVRSHILPSKVPAGLPNGLRCSETAFQAVTNRVQKLASAVEFPVASVLACSSLEWPQLFSLWLSKPRHRILPTPSDLAPHALSLTDVLAFPTWWKSSCAGQWAAGWWRPCELAGFPRVYQRSTKSRQAQTTTRRLRNMHSEVTTRMQNCEAWAMSWSREQGLQERGKRSKNTPDSITARQVTVRLNHPHGFG